MPTEEQLTELRSRVAIAEEKEKEAGKEIRLAERSGMDVTEMRAKLAANVTKLKRVKTAYGV
jgi:hypothetical protein